jgi:hypothetical protein
MTDEQRIRQAAQAEILISLMEQAFVMYRYQSKKIRRAQWAGWDGFVRDWCKRPLFRALWIEVGDQYDQDFTDYVNALMAETSAPETPGS